MNRLPRTLLIILGFACGLAALIPPCRTARSDERATIESAQVDARGVRSHVVHSPFQMHATRIDVILPAKLDPQRTYRAVYVLPVEAQGESRFGDAVRELVARDVGARREAIFVVPTFAELPWYADHPQRADAQQEKHLLQVVLPFVEQTYPVKKEAAARLLLGYSKSGWGAWSLLLRHPAVFGRAAAWDAPLMMDAPGKYGSGPLFGTLENFQRYQISRLVQLRAAELRKSSTPPRLILTGYDNFRGEHQQMHKLLDSLQAPHVYRDGPPRKHDWHSGWVDESLDLLLDDSP
ncbi:MAG: alpha/beta hydrolase-fold protein [Pirellulales bacterium]